MKRLFHLFLSILVLTACNLEKDSSDMLNIRTVLESADSTSLEARVYLEGADGQAVNGALVYVLTPSNEMNLLNFDYSIGCYSTSLGTPVSGNYIVNTESRAYSGVEQNINFEDLSNSMDFTVIQDDLGNDALSGDNISLNHKLSVTWSGIENATAYSFTLVKPDYSIYSASVKEATILIEDSELSSPGSYSLLVKAQYISGDPLFIESNYYAVNEVSSSRFYFEALAGE